jgi:hypothetical protein
MGKSARGRDAYAVTTPGTGLGPSIHLSLASVGPGRPGDRNPTVGRYDPPEKDPLT